MDVPVVVPVTAPDDVTRRDRLAERAVGLVEALRDAPAAAAVGAHRVDDQRAVADVGWGGREGDISLVSADSLAHRDVAEW